MHIGLGLRFSATATQCRGSAYYNYWRSDELDIDLFGNKFNIDCFGRNHKDKGENMNKTGESRYYFSNLNPVP